MTQRVALDNVTHARTRVITARGVEFGDDVQTVAIVPGEFERLIAHYPIFIAKDPATGQFNFIALLGFESGENLFLHGSEWDADYIPLDIRRRPFFIGPSSGAQQGGSPDGVVCIDIDSARVQERTGEPLFLEHGGLTPYLQGVKSMLTELHSGVAAARELLSALSTLELIEPVTLDVRFDSGVALSLPGLYTVHEDKVRGLSGDAVLELHRTGRLQLINLVTASLARVPALIARRNLRTGS